MKLPKRKKLVPLPRLLKRAEKAFNQFIRTRDQDKGCISCGAEVSQAGHYFPVKGYSALRYDEHNCAGQCAYCNCYLHGNQANYRIGLAIRIGSTAVEELEQRAIGNRVKKWTRSELQEIIDKYSAKPSVFLANFDKEVKAIIIEKG